MATGMVIVIVVAAGIAVISFGLAAFLYKLPLADSRVADELSVNVKSLGSTDTEQVQDNEGYTPCDVSESNRGFNKESVITKF